MLHPPSSQDHCFMPDFGSFSVAVAFHSFALGICIRGPFRFVHLMAFVASFIIVFLSYSFIFLLFPWCIFVMCSASIFIPFFTTSNAKIYLSLSLSLLVDLFLVVFLCALRWVKTFCPFAVSRHMLHFLHGCHFGHDLRISLLSDIAIVAVRSKQCSRVILFFIANLL